MSKENSFSFRKIPFSEKEINSLTPMMQAYLRLKNDYLDKLVFYRMGDFYELFFEDAQVAHSVLGITLTARGNSQGEPIPMAGVPFHSVDTYLTKAMNSGLSVVLCEQKEDDITKVITREVAKIITPGTVLDIGVLGDKETRFLASVYKRNQFVEMAWMNFSSGEVWCNKVEIEKFEAELKRINPVEVLVSEKQKEHFLLPQGMVKSTIPDWEYDLILCNQNLMKLLGNNYIDKFDLNDEFISSVISTLFMYIKNTQKQEASHIQTIRWFKDADYLQVDDNSKRNLELFEGVRNHQNSFFQKMDKCANPMGSRLFKNWLHYPTKNMEVIKSRLDRVEYLKNEKMYGSWSVLASQWCDIERCATRIAMKSIKPRELASLRETLRTMPKLFLWAEKMPPYLKGLFINGLPPENIKTLIEKYLAEEPNQTVREGGVIADGVDAELDECRKLQAGNTEFLKDFETEEKKKTNIPNLKVEFNSAQGFYISISNSHLEKVPSHYKRKQTLKNAERFMTDELKQYEEKALSANERALAREKYIFDQLIYKLQPYVNSLQKYAKVLAEWDVLNAFAKLADEQKYNRPDFQLENSKIEMIEGRHPVIEMLQDNFVPNSMHISPIANMAIITGPNMGGKSTFMRQIALMVIMAHMGAFVPAKQLIVGNIDAIFTRIGANDDISSGKSTFMVEMSESAYILNQATNRSLVLLDELGRGTATFDGLSLAWSIAEHLAHKTKALTLFATHYLEMTELAQMYQHVKNYHVSAIDSEQGIIFTHLIECGPASKSYGIHVAELAGVPVEVLAKAKQKLKELERNPTKIENMSKDNHSESIGSSAQHDFITHFLDLDIMEMTPMQAIQWLNQEQKNLKRKLK